MQICESCGKELSDDASFCSHCGTHVKANNGRTRFGIGAVGWDSSELGIEKNKSENSSTDRDDVDEAAPHFPYVPVADSDLEDERPEDEENIRGTQLWTAVPRGQILQDLGVDKDLNEQLISSKESKDHSEESVKTIEGKGNLKSDEEGFGLDEEISKEIKSEGLEEEALEQTFEAGHEVTGSRKGYSFGDETESGQVDFKIQRESGRSSKEFSLGNEEDEAWDSADFELSGTVSNQVKSRTLSRTDIVESKHRDRNRSGDIFIILLAAAILFCMIIVAALLVYLFLIR